MKPLVLIPHVSWRRLSLLQLLDALSQQTMACRVVVLHDDLDEAGGEHENVRLDRTTQRFLHRPVWWPKDLLGGVTPTTKEHAQCARWHIIEEVGIRDESDIGVPVLTLDDDMIIDNDYVRRTIRLLSSALSGEPEAHRGAVRRRRRRWLDPVLSWGGVDTSYRWRHYNEEHDACELILPQSGAMAFYADTFRGLAETELARRSHVRNGNEEIPVAAFLCAREISIFRPKGAGPQPHKLAYDPRSAFRSQKDSLQSLLDWCIAVQAWPHALAIKQLLVGKRPAPLSA